MALEIEGNHLCKVFFSENGKVFIRRVGSMIVQRSDGRVERLFGNTLPDSIALYTGGQSDGKGILEVIERPAQSSQLPTQSVEQLFVVSTPPKRFSDRDGFIFVLGMLAATVMFLWVFTAWVQLRDLRPRPSYPAMNQGYLPRN